MEGSEMHRPTDPRVDASIERLPSWQQAICREVRELVHGGYSATLTRPRPA